MLTVDCKDVLSIQNELVVFVADQVAAIPTLKNHQFTVIYFDDDEIIDNNTVYLQLKNILIQLEKEIILLLYPNNRYNKH